MLDAVLPPRGLLLLGPMEGSETPEPEFLVDRTPTLPEMLGTAVGALIGTFGLGALAARFAEATGMKDKAVESVRKRGEAVGMIVGAGIGLLAGKEYGRQREAKIREPKKRRRRPKDLRGKRRR